MTHLLPSGLTRDHAQPHRAKNMMVTLRAMRISKTGMCHAAAYARRLVGANVTCCEVLEDLSVAGRCHSQA